MFGSILMDMSTIYKQEISNKIEFKNNKFIIINIYINNIIFIINIIKYWNYLEYFILEERHGKEIWCVKAIFFETWFIDEFNKPNLVFCFIAYGIDLILGFFLKQLSKCKKISLIWKYLHLA